MTDGTLLALPSPLFGTTGSHSSFMAGIHIKKKLTSFTNMKDWKTGKQKKTNPKDTANPYLVMTQDSTIPLDLLVVWTNEFPFLLQPFGLGFLVLVLKAPGIRCC